MIRESFKNLAFNLFLLCFGVLVALVLLELGVRALGLYHAPTEDFVEPHPRLGWHHEPNKVGYWTIGDQRIPVRINSKGLRDKEYSYKKEENIFRILVLGDSFTEAFQVPLNDSFCKVLERRLNQENRRFEVINAGLGGVGTDYELLFLKREGFRYDPDLILVAFFPNDVLENYRSKEILNSMEGEQALYYGKEGFAVTLKQFLAEHSHAFNYFGLLAIEHIPGLTHLLVDLQLIGAVPVEKEANGIPLHYSVLAEEYSSQIKEAWMITALIFEKLAKEVRTRDDRLAVVSIPYREQVYESLWDQQLTRPEMRQRKWDLSKPDELLAERLHSIGVPLLRLLPEFKKFSRHQALYYGVDGKISDGHWNVAGHQLAGRLIYQWLVREELIPSKKP
jgi:hypothetical protein